MAHVLAFHVFPQLLSVGWALSRCPLDTITQGHPPPPPPLSTAPESAFLQCTGQGACSLSCSPCHLWGAKPLPSLPLPGSSEKAKNSMALAQAWKEGQEWPVKQPPPPWNPWLPWPPCGLLFVQEASGQPKATGKDRLGNFWDPLNRVPWLYPFPASVPPFFLGAPNTQTQMLPPPNNWEKTQGVAPKSPWLCSWLRVAGRESGACGQHCTLAARPSDFHLRGHSPLLPHRSQIPPPHLPPPGRVSPSPGGEDSLIKVFRNAGGWRLGRGGV